MKRKVTQDSENAPEIKKKRNDNSLYKAVEQGELSRVLSLLQTENANINAVDSWTGNTLLHAAAQNGHITIVNFLLANGISINTFNAYGQTPLYLAAQQGHHRIVNILIANNAILDKYDKDIEDMFPLYIASLHGHVKVVEALLKHGANVHTVDNVNRTALHTAAISGHTEVIKLLLTYGASINVQDARKDTPLHMTIYNRHVEAAALLLTNNADIFIEGEDGLNSLRHAMLQCIYSYPIFVIAMDKRPSLEMLANYQANIPLLIKDKDNNFWFYGLTIEQKALITQLTINAADVENIIFSPQAIMLKAESVHPNIYLDIAQKKAHSDICNMAILKFFMVHLSMLENQKKLPDINLLSSLFTSIKSAAPFIVDYYNRRHFIRNCHQLSKAHTLFYQNKNKSNAQDLQKRCSPPDVEFKFMSY